MASLINPASIFLFIIGLILGYGLCLLVQKLMLGHSSPKKIKEEFDSYRNQVEEHFEITSEKFKTMTDQYQSLYQHLAKGATSLCKSDKISPLLEGQANIIKQAKQLEEKTTPTKKQAQKNQINKEPSANKQPSKSQQPSTNNQPSAKKSKTTQPKATTPNKNKT